MTPLTAAGLEIGQSSSNSLKGGIGDILGQDTDLDGDGILDPLSLTSTSKLSTLWITPIFKFGYSNEDAEGGLRPYAIIGAGYYQTKAGGGSISYKGRTSTGLTLTRTVPVSSAGAGDSIGYNLGVGFTVLITKKFELGGDFRFHQTFTGDNETQLFFPAARMTYLFGRAPKKDDGG